MLVQCTYLIFVFILCHRSLFNSHSLIVLKLEGSAFCYYLTTVLLAYSVRARFLWSPCPSTTSSFDRLVPQQFGFSVTSFQKRGKCYPSGTTGVRYHTPLYFTYNLLEGFPGNGHLYIHVSYIFHAGMTNHIDYFLFAFFMFFFLDFLCYM